MGGGNDGDDFIENSNLAVEKALFYLFVYFWFFEIGFLCSFGACPGTLSVDQAGLELTEIKGVHHHCPS